MEADRRCSAHHFRRVLQNRKGRREVEVDFDRGRVASIRVDPARAGGVAPPEAWGLAIDPLALALEILRPASIAQICRYDGAALDGQRRFSFWLDETIERQADHVVCGGWLVQHAGPSATDQSQGALRLRMTYLLRGSGADLVRIETRTRMWALRMQQTERA